MLELLRFTLVSAAVLLIPGLCVAVWLPHRLVRGYGWIWAAGLGLAVTPLLYLLLDLLGVEVTVPVLAGAYGPMLAAAALRVRTRIRARRSDGRGPSGGGRWAALVGAGVVAVFLLRWSAVRHLEVLPGYDALAHSVIADLFLIHQGIPGDYSPYQPLESFTYHFGSHALTAVISLFSGLPVHRVQLLLEPLLIALSAATTAVLAHKLTGNRRVAGAAGLLVGFVAPFPAWYLNWARVPQVAAMVLVPLVIGAYWEAGRGEAEHGGDDDSDAYGLHGAGPPEGQWATGSAVAVLTAGTFLTHYRMALVLAYALLAYLTYRLLTAKKGFRLRELVRQLRLGTVVFLPPIVLVSPWLVNVVDSFGFGGTSSAASGNLPPPFYFSMRRIAYIWDVPTTELLLALCAAGLITSLIYVRMHTLFLALWVGVMLVFSNPYGLGLPWSGAVDSVTAVSVSYVAVSIVAATVPAEIALRLTRIGEQNRERLHWAAMLAVSVLGAVATSQILWPPAVLVSDADVRAFEWVEDNVAASARFASPFAADRSTVLQPLDGGAWLGYFTGLGQVNPLALYPVEESPDGYIDSIETLGEAFFSANQAYFHRQLANAGVTHLFLGSMPVVRTWPHPEEPMFELIYEESGSAVFRVLDPP